MKFSKLHNISANLSKCIYIFFHPQNALTRVLLYIDLNLPALIFKYLSCVFSYSKLVFDDLNHEIRILVMFLNDSESDIVCVNETLINDKNRLLITNDLTSDNKYVIVSNDRPKTSGKYMRVGFTLILVSKSYASNLEKVDPTPQTQPVC